MVVAFEVEEVAEAVPPPTAVVAPLLLFPALLLLSTLAMDGEEPNNSDDLPPPNTPAVAEAENRDPPAPPVPLLLPLFENPPLAAGKPFPLLRDSKCRENRAASFDTWVDAADDAIVVVEVVAVVGVVVVVVVGPETPLLLLPLMPPILLALPPAAACREARKWFFLAGEPGADFRAGDNWLRRIAALGDWCRVDPIDDLLLSGVLNDICVVVGRLLQKQNGLCGSEMCVSTVLMVHASLSGESTTQNEQRVRRAVC